MGKYLNMVVVLTLITAISGLCLGGLYDYTKEEAENNVLRFEKLPAVVSLYEMANAKELNADDLKTVGDAILADKKELDIGEEKPFILFVVEKDGKPYAAAVEQFGSGYGGNLGVMVGFRLDTGDLVGIGITSMSETPGVGTRVKAKSFTAQFIGLGMDDDFRIKKDGGRIDALSGATVSSTAAANAVIAARDFYKKHESKIREAVNK